MYKLCGEREGKKILSKLRKERYIRCAPVAVSAERRPTTCRVQAYKVTNQRAVSPRLLSASGLRKDAIPLAFDTYSGLYFSECPPFDEGEDDQAPEHTRAW